MSRDNEVADLRRALAEAVQSRDEAVTRYERMAVECQTEAQHHLRNAFAMVRAMARQTVTKARNVEEYFGILDGKLTAYASAQSAVLRGGGHGLDLETLLRDQISRYGLSLERSIEFEGPGVSILGRAAGLMALVFHELALQFLPAGEIDEAGAALRVAWSIAEQDTRTLAIEWIESWSAGNTRARRELKISGWIAKAISHQLDGSVGTQVAPGRSCLTICLPADCYMSAVGAAPRPIAAQAGSPDRSA